MTRIRLSFPANAEGDWSSPFVSSFVSNSFPFDEHSHIILADVSIILSYIELWNYFKSCLQFLLSSTNWGRLFFILNYLQNENVLMIHLLRFIMFLIFQYVLFIFSKVKSIACLWKKNSVRFYLWFHLCKISAFSFLAIIRDKKLFIHYIYIQQLGKGV